MQPNVEAAKNYLQSHDWPVGMQNALINSSQKFPIRYFIVDDSGSMAQSDGTRVVRSGNTAKRVKCSRWAELGESLKFHAGLAEAICLPTEFRLLNGSTPIILGRGDPSRAGYQALTALLDASPGGLTPLCQHIREVTDQIRMLESQLRANAQRAVIIIATDGESSDGDLLAAMRPLMSLPVFVVVRLCTDEENVCQYWGKIDEQLELEMDVLDDLIGEAGEINAHNKWLTYGEPLHRLREWGSTLKEMDRLDEEKLSAEQMRAVVAMIFLGSGASELPHPEVDFKKFAATVKSLNDKERTVLDPLTMKQDKWIKESALKSAFGGGGGCCVM